MPSGDWKSQTGKEVRWLSPDEQRAWRSLLSVVVLLMDRLDEDLERGSGMSHAAYAVLANLAEAPGRALRLGELAAIVWSSRTRMTYLIDQLEKPGWVRRQRAPDDRRGLLAVLTDEGARALEHAAPIHLESVRQRVFNALSPSAVGQLYRLCQRLLPGLVEPGASTIIDAIIQHPRPARPDPAQRRRRGDGQRPTRPKAS